MFSHVMVGADDLEKSKFFYDAILGAIGGKPGVTDPKDTANTGDPETAYKATDI